MKKIELYILLISLLCGCNGHFGGTQSLNNESNGNKISSPINSKVTESNNKIKKSNTDSLNNYITSVNLKAINDRIYALSAKQINDEDEISDFDKLLLKSPWIYIILFIIIVSFVISIYYILNHIVYSNDIKDIYDIKNRIKNLENYIINNKNKPTNFPSDYSKRIMDLGNRINELEQEISSINKIKKQQNNDNDIKDNILQYETGNKPNVIYLTRPISDGKFMNDPKLYQSEESYYIFYSNGKNAEFEFKPHNDTMIRKAMDNEHTTIMYACNIFNRVQHPQKCECISKGTAHLENGIWIVDQKAKVNYE